MRRLYTFLFYFLLPFILLRLLWRSRYSPLYRQRWRERFGIFSPPPFKDCIWIHAVSFGEAKVAIRLIEALQTHNSELNFVVTTMTVTGSQQIQKITSEKIFHVYLPYDVPFAIKNFLNRIHPTLFMMIETELWPNLITICSKKNIPILVVNARLSEKSLTGYMRISGFMRQVLTHVTAVYAQTLDDAKRFIALGVCPEKVTVLGNIKFDMTPPESLITAGKNLKKLFYHRPIFIAASTHPHEEVLILEAFQWMRKTISDLLLILVPRHPERFDQVMELCQTQSWRVVRRTAANENFNDVDILLGDTMGELWLYYAASDIAFVGGSLVNHGGHNFLEPAALGLPIISGEYYANFKEIGESLAKEEGISFVKTPQELAHTVIQLWQNKTRREQQGHNASRVFQKNQGTLDRYVARISDYSILKLK